MNIQLYKVSAGDTYGSPYAYAVGYAPLQDRKSFVHPRMKERNDEFIKLCGSKPGIEIDSTQRLWPDILYCGGGHISYFVSEKVVENLRNAGIELLDVTEFPIAGIENNKKSRLKIPEAPRYFVIEAKPEIYPFWERMGVDLNPEGKPILSPLPSPWPPKPMVYHKDKYHGGDLVSHEGYFNHNLYCTQRIIDLAEANDWKNIEFKPAGLLE